MCTSAESMPHKRTSSVGGRGGVRLRGGSPFALLFFPIPNLHLGAPLMAQSQPACPQLWPLPHHLAHPRSPGRLREAPPLPLPAAGNHLAPACHWSPAAQRQQHGDLQRDLQEKSCSSHPPQSRNTARSRRSTPRRRSRSSQRPPACPAWPTACAAARHATCWCTEPRARRWP